MNQKRMKLESLDALHTHTHTHTHTCNLNDKVVKNTTFISDEKKEKINQYLYPFEVHEKNKKFVVFSEKGEEKKKTTIKVRVAKNATLKVVGKRRTRNSLSF